LQNLFPLRSDIFVPEDLVYVLLAASVLSEDLFLVGFLTGLVPPSRSDVSARVVSFLSNFLMGISSLGRSFFVVLNVDVGTCFSVCFIRQRPLED